MKRNIIWLTVSCLVAIVLLLTSCSPTVTKEEEAVTEETEILIDVYRSGWIYEDEIWSGTVHITGDVTVDPEVTLTILPGTKVLFAAHQDDRHGGACCSTRRG